MEIQDSCAIVSVNWASWAAGIVKYKILKQRMKRLKEIAADNCSPRKYLFFGPKKEYTKKELRDEMYRLWHDTGYRNPWHCDFRYLSAVDYEMAKAIQSAARHSETDGLLLSRDDIATLEFYTSRGNESVDEESPVVQ